MTEFDDVIRLLHENRPEATELELDQIKQRVRRRAARPSRRREAMKSRLAILTMLVLGMLFSATGAGLAIQGFADSDDASVAQYGAGDVAGEEDESGPGDVAGEQDEQAPAGDEETLQPARQVETGAQAPGELPFTGFLAIPVLIGGVALLTAGAVLRRRTGDDES
jgi:hypothetical protein